MTLYIKIKNFNNQKKKNFIINETNFYCNTKKPLDNLTNNYSKLYNTVN